MATLTIRNIDENLKKSLKIKITATDLVRHQQFIH